MPPPTDAGHAPEPALLLRGRPPPGRARRWAREVTERELPVATTLAGVNMSLEPGAVREMHWHTEAESAYMLSGCARIAAVEPTGRASADEVEEGISGTSGRLPARHFKRWRGAARVRRRRLLGERDLPEWPR